MIQPRFLSDQDLNEHIVAGVIRREPAIEFVRLRDVGLERRPDSEVLTYAAAEGLLVVSHDVNTMIDEAFARLAAREPLGGLFMVQQRGPIAPVIESLVLIWSASEAEEWRGRVVYLPF